MSNSPAFQWYPAEYLADENVTLMTLEEEGAYNRAMNYCWREGSIPSDPIMLSRLLKNAPIEVVRTVVQRFRKIETENGSRLIHERLEKERQKQIEWKLKSAKAGKLSGKVRRAKKLQAEPTFENGSHLVEPNHEPNTNSLSLSLSLSSSVVHKYSRSTLEEIYEAYPKHVGKTAALAAIEKALRKNGHPDGWLLERVRAYAEQREGEEKQFTPHPATWFNQGRYEDENLQPKPKLIWGPVNGATN